MVLASVLLGVWEGRKEEQSYNFHLNWESFPWKPRGLSAGLLLFASFYASYSEVAWLFPKHILQLFRQILSSRNVTNELPCGVGMGPQPAGANYFKNFQANQISVSQVTSQEASESRASFLCYNMCCWPKCVQISSSWGPYSWLWGFR